MIDNQDKTAVRLEHAHCFCKCLGHLFYVLDCQNDNRGIHRCVSGKCELVCRSIMERYFCRRILPSDLYELSGNIRSYHSSTGSVKCPCKISLSACDIEYGHAGLWIEYTNNVWKDDLGLV